MTTIISATTNTGNNAALTAYNRRQLAGLTTMSSPSSSSVLQTANTAIFQMTSLMSTVRSLSKQADNLTPTNTAGVAGLRTQVDKTLKEFNEISKSVATSLNTKQESTATTNASTTPPTLDELRSTLASMKTNLQENVRKVGGSVQKAILSGGTLNDANATPTSSLLTLWAKLYPTKSGTSYL